MIYGTYLSAAGMANEQTRQDVIANNLANVETTGFKRMFTLFAERSPQAGMGDLDDPTGDRLANMTGGRWMLPTQLDREQGGLEQTDNPLDLAIAGDAFLVVDAAGEQRLTRDGRLAINSAGELALAGDPSVRVLDAEDQPIVLADRPADSVVIDERGILRDRVGGQPLATLKLSTAQELRPIGGGLYQPGTPPTEAQEFAIHSGYVERSNVDPTVELTRLIEAGRLLEANANMIRFQDASLGKLIEAGSIG